MRPTRRRPAKPGRAESEARWVEAGGALEPWLAWIFHTARRAAMGPQRRRLSPAGRGGHADGTRHGSVKADRSDGPLSPRSRLGLPDMFETVTHGGVDRGTRRSRSIADSQQAHRRPRASCERSGGDGGFPGRPRHIGCLPSGDPHSASRLSVPALALGASCLARSDRPRRRMRRLVDPVNPSVRQRLAFRLIQEAPSASARIAGRRVIRPAPSREALHRQARPARRAKASGAVDPWPHAVRCGRSMRAMAPRLLRLPPTGLRVHGTVRCRGPADRRVSGSA